MSLRKVFIGLACLGVFVFGASQANAMTVAEINAKIVELQNIMAQLQAQLNSAPLQTTDPGTINTSGWCYNFITKLKYKDSGKEVEALQTALKKEGLYFGKIGGNLGLLTRNAIKKFQEKYKNDILTPWGLSIGTGNMGNTTIAKLNILYGCSAPITNPNPTPNPTPTCQNLWWFDGSNNTYCQQKQFCGAYMYYGLRIFTTETKCKSSLPNTCGSCPQYMPMHPDVEANAKKECEAGGGIWGVVTDKCGCSQPFSCTKFITLTSPSGGESWQTGKSYDIKWSSVGIEKVNIYLSGSCFAASDGVIGCSEGCPPLTTEKCQAGCGNVQIANAINASSGQYSWTIPSSQRLLIDAKIMIEEYVSDRQNQICMKDSSDNSFNIVLPIPNSIVEKSNQFMISKVGNDFFNRYISLDYSKSKYSEADKFCIDNPNYCSAFLQKPYYFMVYSFKMPGKSYIDELISLNVDTSGNVIIESGIDVPDCINSPKECEFPIDETQAIEIAKTAGLEPGIKKWETSFHWSAGDLKTFVWTVSSTLSESTSRPYSANGRGASIDANSGKVYPISDWQAME